MATAKKKTTKKKTKKNVTKSITSKTTEVKKQGPKGPTKNPITGDDIRKVEAMAAMGLNVRKIAAIMGISKATFERRCVDNPELYEALERGRANAEMQVASTALKMAKSGKNTSMTQYWLNCRAGWKATTIHEHTGKDGSDLNPETAFARRIAEMTDEELEAYVASKEAGSK